MDIIESELCNVRMQIFVCDVPKLISVDIEEDNSIDYVKSIIEEKYGLSRK